MATGRNEPCPCGSGRKFKKCCSRSDDVSPPADLLWSRINRADEAVTEALLRHAKEHLSTGAALEARRDFWGANEAEELHGEDLQMFVPWMLYCWVPRTRLWRDSPPAGGHPPTIAGTFLARHRSRLDDLESKYLDAGVREPFSFFEVTAVEKGRSLDLVDLFRACPFHVSERSGSLTLSPHDVLFARIVSVEGWTTMSGAGPIALTPNDKIDLIDFVERLRRRRRALTDDDVWKDGDAVRFEYLKLMRRRLNPPPPVLQNTDGKPSSFTRFTSPSAIRLRPSKPSTVSTSSARGKRSSPRAASTSAALFRP